MVTKVKLICVGAAVQDVFLQGKIFTPEREEDGYVEEFKLGSKNDIEGVVFSVGGGATNAAVTFERQGMYAYYLGKVGDDVPGKVVRDVLRQEGVDTSLMTTNRKLGTGYSVLLLAPNGERTILTYRGASEHFELETSDFHSKTSDWIYISSLAGNFEVLETVFAYAREHDIKVALNPGKKELQQAAKLKHLLPHCTILSANKEELAMLFGGDTLEQSVRNAAATVKYVVGTDGPKGCIATDGEKLYKAGMYKDVKVVDRTGAGDAFCSGFTAMVALGEPMEKAITFASANSTSVVQYIGAKTGILKQNAKLGHMAIKSEAI